MQVSLNGLLVNVAEKLKHLTPTLSDRVRGLDSDKFDAFLLESLAVNLRELHDRWKAGEADSVLKEFFDIYPLSELTEAEFRILERRNSDKRC